MSLRKRDVVTSIEYSERDGKPMAETEELGLDFVDTGQTLRLFNPLAGQFLFTPEEEAAARLQAEARAARAEAERIAEAEARRRAEADLEQLRSELARLKKSPAKRSKK